MLSNAEQTGIADARDVHSDDDAVNFPSQVKTAIHARFGLPAAKGRCPIALTDAPLFGELSLQQIGNSSFNRAEYALPPRRHADGLLSLYWRHIEPLEPLLDRDRFYRRYRALFSGGEPDGGERIFTSAVNVVFALSTQLQESIPSKQRDEESKTFFLRARSLLCPESIMWESGSVELVQCLLLMGRYLQCTRNLHQTWMVVGSAVRIAQSLGLHVPDKHSSSPDEDRSLVQKVWQHCIFTDRYGDESSSL